MITRRHRDGVESVEVICDIVHEGHRCSFRYLCEGVKQAVLVRQIGQNIAVAGKGTTPASQPLTSEESDALHEVRLGLNPLAILLNHLTASAVSTYLEWVAPNTGTSNVDIMRLSLVDYYSSAFIAHSGLFVVGLRVVWLRVDSRSFISQL